ncbi:MAG: amidohydrolase family protein [Planctomycetes bacterium]|nr:amidohydrolase family protein [Planctomycetota bacterium]
MATAPAQPTAPRYDVHAHVGADFGFYLRGWWPYSCTVQDLLQHLDDAGIDRAVCFPFTFSSAYDPYAFADGSRVTLLPGRVPFDRENMLLVRELDRIDVDRRLYPLAMFDPTRRVAEQIRNVEQLTGRIAGLKTQPTIIESPIRGLLDEGRDLMALAEQHDWPVLIHTAIYAQDPFSQVADCIAVAAAYPKVRFNLAHSLRFHADYLRAAAQLPNVWVDCAAHLAGCQLARDPDSPFIAPRGHRVDADYARPAEVLTVIHEMLAGRYLWGSDNPFMSWADDMIRVVFSYRDEIEVLGALPERVRRDMMSAAAEEWLFGVGPASCRSGPAGSRFHTDERPGDEECSA